MGYELRDHTADVAVAATGASLEDVFAAVADGLGAASCDKIPDEVGDRFSLSVSAESREALLFDYLDELIYLRDVRRELPVDHRVAAIRGPDADRSATDGSDATVDADNTAVDADADDTATDSAENDEWTLEASARGIPLDSVDAREVKAVTYSEMALERTTEDAAGAAEPADEWEAYVVFDV